MISSIRLHAVFLARLVRSPRLPDRTISLRFFTGDSLRVCKITPKLDCFGLIFGSEMLDFFYRFQAVLQEHQHFPGSCALTKAPILGAGDDAIIHA
ncbi:MAG: hypothetical protein WCF30_05595 [Terracidiphilus sp.]